MHPDEFPYDDPKLMSRPRKALGTNQKQEKENIKNENQKPKPKAGYYVPNHSPQNASSADPVISISSSSRQIAAVTPPTA